jgi:Ca2+-binding RTX toxin-like protein
VSTTSISGGGNHNVNVYSGTVALGNGNNLVNISGVGQVTVGNGRDTISIGNNGTVSAGSGNDRIAVQGYGRISVGGGNDTLTINKSGQIIETGASGHDTINLGSGSDTIVVQGQATVSGAANGYGRGALGSATIAGGSLIVNHLSTAVTQDIAVAGKITVIGGAAASEFIGGSGSTLMKGGSGHDTFIGGSGHDTMTGSGNHNVFEFLAANQGGQHVITNFVSTDQLNVEGHALSYLISHHDVTYSDGNTYITVDGGKTTIELQGVTAKGAAATGGGMTHSQDPFNTLRHFDDPSTKQN